MVRSPWPKIPQHHELVAAASPEFTARKHLRQPCPTRHPPGTGVRQLLRPGPPRLRGRAPLTAPVLG
eukprot:10710569-Alexandrium_andersonii.AAC.1